MSDEPKTEGIMGIDSGAINAVVTKFGDLIHDATNLIGDITDSGLHVAGSVGSLKIDLLITPAK